MKRKEYTAQQAAELVGKTYEALVKQLQRDMLKPKSKRKYPSAHKLECCGAWMISEKDLK